MTYNTGNNVVPELCCIFTHIFSCCWRCRLRPGCERCLHWRRSPRPFPSSLSSTRLAVCCATVTLVQLCPVTDPDPHRCLSLPPPPGGDVTGVAPRHRPPDPASWDSSSHCVCPLGSGEAGLLHLFAGNLEGTTYGRLRMSPGFSTAVRHAATSQT